MRGWYDSIPHAWPSFDKGRANNARSASWYALYDDTCPDYAFGRDTLPLDALICAQFLGARLGRTALSAWNLLTCYR